MNYIQLRSISSPIYPKQPGLFSLLMYKNMLVHRNIFNVDVDALKK